MKKVLLLAFVLGSFNVFAEDKPIVGQSDASTIDCSKIFAGNADKGTVSPTTEKPASQGSDVRR